MFVVCLFLTLNVLRKHEQISYSLLKVISSGILSCYLLLYYIWTLAHV